MFPATVFQFNIVVSLPEVVRDTFYLAATSSIQAALFSFAFLLLKNPAPAALNNAPMIR